MTQASNLIAEYISHGWELVPIAPGTKGPKGPEAVGWNLKANCIKSAADLPPGYGVGLAHTHNGTMSLDIDSAAAFEMLAAAGIDLQALLDAPDAVQIKSNRPGRHKLIYRLPVPGMTPQTEQVKHDGEMAYELRCGTANGQTVQDVLPPTIHPDTGRPYEFAGRGHWQNLPMVPPEVMNHWLDRIAQKASKPSNSASETLCNGADFERVKSAVYAINPSCSRADWVAVGMALHTTGHPDAFEVWDKWSAQSDKYKPSEMAGQWSSFSTDKPGAAIGLGTLFDLAKDNGWTPPQPDASRLFTAVPAATQTAEDATPVTVRLDDLDTAEPPAPSFRIDQLMPDGEVTLLAAHGGTGKTAVAQHIAVCLAMGLPCMGKKCKPSKVTFYSAEDGADVMRFKFAKECKRMGIKSADLAKRLTLIDASEANPVLFHEVSQGGARTGQGTQELARLQKLMTDAGSEVLIIDNASDVYGADENSRPQVRSFLRSLRKLITPINGAVLLLVHVDKMTARAGGSEGYSGSTAWHNSVRSRLYLTADTTVTDGLLLEQKKSNRGRCADPIVLQWVDGLPTFKGTYTETPASDADHMSEILKMLHEFYTRGEFCSTSPTAHTNAFKVLSTDPKFPKITRKHFDQLFRDADRGGFIQRETYRTATRKQAERWRVTFAPSAPSAPS